MTLPLLIASYIVIGILFALVTYPSKDSPLIPGMIALLWFLVIPIAVAYGLGLFVVWINKNAEDQL